MTLVESGFLLVAAGAVARYVWMFGSKGFSYLKNKLTYCINCNNDNSFFWNIEEWIDQTDYMKTCKNIALKNHGDRTMKTLGYGLHILKHEGVRLLIYKNQSESKDSHNIRETMNIILLTKNLVFLEKWIRDVKAAQNNVPYLHTKVFVSKYGYDTAIERPLINRQPTLDKDSYKQIVDDIHGFLAKEKLYGDRGIPYKRGYLFYGPPGNGKTTTILCIAQELKRHIKMVNLSELTNSDLVRIVSNTDNKTILVLEDIDCVKASNDRAGDGEEKGEEMGGVTLNVLLNCLDGLLTQHGQLTFATTNHVDKLDPALIRAGRMDFKTKFENSTPEQAEAYYNRFFGDGAGAEFSKEHAGKPMCELEKIVLERLNNEETQPR